MVRIRLSIIALLGLATAGAASAGQAVSVLQESGAFDSPSDSAQPKPNKAQKGQGYVLLSTQGEWYQVQWDEKPAWLKKGKQPGQGGQGGSGGASGGGGQTGSTQQQNNLEVKSDVALKRVIAANLNVRSSPGMTGSILGTLPMGTMVVEQGGTGEWRKISFRGQTGYVFGQYLESESGAKPTDSTNPQSNPTGTSQTPSSGTPSTGTSGSQAPAGTAGALPGGGNTLGSSGLGTPSNQQGNQVQKSPFQDLLSLLTGQGSTSNGTSSATPTPAPTPTPEPATPVTPGTPEVPTSSGTTTISPPGSTSDGTSTGTSRPGDDSMWDDAATGTSTSSTPASSSSTTPSGASTSADPSATPADATTAPGTPETTSPTPGAPTPSGGTDGVGFGAREGSREAGAEGDERDGEEKDGDAADAADDAATKDDAAAASPEAPATEDEATKPAELELSDEDVELVARIVQGEAIQCSHEARVAVAAVVLNRLRSPSFPDTVRRVVQQKLQFPSFAPEVRDQLLAQPLDEGCLEAAREAVGGFDPTDGATHFYNPHLAERPTWVKKMDKTIRLGERPDDTLEFYRPRPTAPATTTASMFDE